MGSQNSSLSSQSVRSYGFAIIPHVLSEIEIDSLANELSAAGPKRSRAGARHLLRVPVVRSVAEDARLLTIARKALGENALPFRATLFDKSPSANWLVAWHQDTALPLFEKRETTGWGPWSTKDGVVYAHAPAEALEQVLALRVHLDDSTESNGPLRVIPDTHRFGVLTDGEILERVGNAVGVSCTVARGGVIGMRPLVIHGSSKSESELPRRVLHIEYASRLDIADGLSLAIT